MFEYDPEGWRIGTPENRSATQNYTALNDACRDGRILEGRAVVCDASHNLLVDLGCMQGMIPREEGAVGIREGTVRDIAIISRVNHPVCFLVTGFEKRPDGSTTAILSRRAAQEKCISEFISTLIPGDVINARITHLENFGAFADIGCGVVALLPIDSISVSRIDHPRERFSAGMDIRAVVKSVENGRSVESYGVFVELTPNLAGLAELKEGVLPGQQASVYVKSILPSRMKIKLVIIDTFDYNYRPAPPKYFFTGKHMDRFVYSPAGSEKEIISVFSPAPP